MQNVSTNQQGNDNADAIFDCVDNRTIHATGGDFRTVYNLETVQPKPEYLAIYNTVKAELLKMGLPIK